METAVAFAACQFSMGATFKVVLCKVLNLEPGDSLERSAERKDIARVKKAEKAASVSEKKHRKQLIYKTISKELKKKGTEGASYVPGGFDY